MWVEPVTVVRNMVVGTERRHPTRGCVFRRWTFSSSPPLTFYPLALLIFDTFLTFPLLVAAITIYALPGEKIKRPVSPYTFDDDRLCVLFYRADDDRLEQITRYITPVHGMLALLAGVGAVGLVTCCSARWRHLDISG